MAELEATMTYPEFVEWMAYFRGEAGGSPAAPDWRRMMQSMRMVSEFQNARR